VESTNRTRKAREGAREGQLVLLVKADDPTLYNLACDLSGRDNRKAWRDAEFDADIIERARAELAGEGVR
jgi:hypothetical protein